MAEAIAAGDRDPIIEPSSFDLVVSGTGLVEALVAAAAAASGKSVLHIDPHPFYGVHFSSLSPQSLSSFLNENAPTGAASAGDINQSSPESSGFVAFDLEPRQVYSHVDITGEVPEPSTRFLLDVSGPRVLYCADPMVDVMLRSGASHHLEFKSVDANLIYLDGKLQIVPDSREAIFRDTSINLIEKTQMMKFLNLLNVGSEGKISEADLKIPFVQFLEKQRLPAKIRQLILYAIAMADHDQDNEEHNENLISTKEGVESLSLYGSSIGRFPNATGAFIYPIYGQGELPQAFCRLAAVKGALYVLRMPASSLLFHEEEKVYKGIRLATGQDIYFKKIIMDSSSLALPPIESTINPSDGYKVARMICITKGSLYLELSNILITFPPRSLFPAQETSIRVLQLGSGLAVCPPGFFLVYCSIKCKDAAQGKEDLVATKNALFGLPADVPNPVLLWSASYVQDLTQVAHSFSLSSSPMPDGSLDYRRLLKSTEELFHSLYPEEEFFPASKPSEEEEDDISQS